MMIVEHEKGLSLLTIYLTLEIPQRPVVSSPMYFGREMQVKSVVAPLVLDDD